MLVLDSFLGVKSREVQELKNVASKIPGTKVKATKLDSSGDRRFRIIVECSNESVISNAKTSGTRVNWRNYVTNLVGRPGVTITVLQRGDDSHPCIASITGPESSLDVVKTDLQHSLGKVTIKSVSLEKGPSETYKVEVIFTPSTTAFQIEEFKGVVAQKFGWPRFYMATNASAKRLSIPAS